jgi:hypothetical protein
MNNNLNNKQLPGCFTYVEQPSNSFAEKGNCKSNSQATVSLKSLAAKVLQRNQQSNSDATNDKSQCNLDELNNIFYATDELKDFLGDEWDEYKDNEIALKAWTTLLYERKLIEQGIAPPSFTATTYCKQCGQIPCPPELVNGGRVLSCMWCFNREMGLPIPKINNLKI